MPEGDTIYRAARTLDRALRGRWRRGMKCRAPRVLRCRQLTTRRRMPEGDTIYRVARTLDLALRGQVAAGHEVTRTARSAMPATDGEETDA